MYSFLEAFFASLLLMHVSVSGIAKEHCLFPKFSNLL